jgi:predicted RNA-binding Zn ribbon-like protein
MNLVNNLPVSMGSAMFAAKRAADLVFILQNKEQLNNDALLQEINRTLRKYGEHNSDVVAADLDDLKVVSARLHDVFATTETQVTAELLNAVLTEYASVPRLTAHAATPWHIHVDSNDHAPWAEWFASSSALALAVILAEKQRNPGGICASKSCGRPFIDTGKGSGRLYCSPRCASRERVAMHRKVRAQSDKNDEKV